MPAILFRYVCGQSDWGSDGRMCNLFPRSQRRGHHTHDARHEDNKEVDAQVAVSLLLLQRFNKYNKRNVSMQSVVVSYEISFTLCCTLKVVLCRSLIIAPTSFAVSPVCS